MIRNIRTRARLLVVGGVAAAALAIPATAWAVDTDPCVNASPSNTNCGGTATDVEPGAQVQAETVLNNSSGGSLPVTGGDVVGLAIIGAGLTAGGIVLARQGRRNRSAS